MDTTKEAYKAKMEAQLDVWSARIAELKGIDEKWSQLSGSLEAVWAKLSPDQTTKH